MILACKAHTKSDPSSDWEFPFLHGLILEFILDPI